ncbi:hypothetical protein EJ04DRAFT_479509 [Polyplosphaeria fusca]|uniref:Rhodopsin domain-containing protein n=1 Tax=Polyplosphaeria fusca TaxID=682080 RepID=A0A9P4QK18_9PLEO|nr:hypothetical protein EJ04DRAFT_479509 [Polyplosphaeria fusca]
MTSRFPTAAEMAAWPEPDFVDPDTVQPLALAITIPVTMIAVIFMTCRIYSRTVLVPAIGWDDWLMLLAAVSTVANNVMVLVSMNSEIQMGYHLWDIKPETLFGIIKASQIGLSSQLLMCLVWVLGKVSILLTYLRIFPTKRNKWFCYIMLAFTVTSNVAIFWLVLFQCSPLETYWQVFKFLETAKCLNVKAIYYVYSGLNVFTDFLIFLWPAKDLAAVQISFRQRVTLISMFCFGVIICIVGTVRAYYTWLYLNEYDAFWYGAKLLIICAVELSLGIACGCLPGCKPLLSKLFPRVFGTLSESSAPQRYHASPKNDNFNRSDNTLGRPQSQSFQLHSLPSQEAGTIIREQKIVVQSHEAGALQMPRRVVTRVGLGSQRGRRNDVERGSGDSQEFIILHESSHDELPGLYSTDRW